MTKEDDVYIGTLNLLGTVLPDPARDYDVENAVARERGRAANSVRGYVQCPFCSGTVPYDGPLDGEHFADLWEHLISRHEVEAFVAHCPALDAWEAPVMITLSVRTP